ncbi:MAG: helix-turn-helix domain-containing protein [Opitutaceae bacterium]
MGNASSDQWKIPLLIPKVHRVFSGIAPRLKRAIDIYIESPLDAEVELWSILLALSDKQISLGMEQVDTLDQRRVRDACSLIESGLNGAIYAEVIAETLEISVSQLGRIFKRRLGCPVATYIRRRRVQLAHELLCYSEEPIQEVATRVGVPDLANFNRMLKREFKLSPREIRERKNGLSVRELD